MTARILDGKAVAENDPGVPALITAETARPGATVVDVGTGPTTGAMPLTTVVERAEWLSSR